MKWVPRDPIYYEKGKQIVADYKMLKSVVVVSKKWNLHTRTIRRYLRLMGVEAMPIKQGKDGRFLPQYTT